MTPVEIRKGTSPIVLGLPHTGTHVPQEIADRLNARGLELADTDWHIHLLYDGLLDDATTVRATFHRYVVDANRDPAGASLYPGQNTTGLVPETDFDGVPIWKDGEAPTEADVAARREAFHAPYHAALAAEIERVKAIHGVAILYDCHSIRSHIPFLFEGKLPDFNIGTNGGATCHPLIEQATVEVCGAADGYTSILNGRFKGAGPHATTAGRPTMSTPSRWSSPSRPIWRARAHPSPMTRRRRAPFASISRPFSPVWNASRSTGRLPPEETHDQPAPQHPHRAGGHRHRDHREVLAD